MSAQTLLPAWALPGAGAGAGAGDGDRAARPGLALLTRIELRKTADTRAGKWLLIIMGLLVVAAVVIMFIWGGDGDRDWRSYAQIALLPLGVFGPVLGILTMTSEWSQRTALTTFTLVPQRGRVIVAKCIAAMILALGATVLTLVVATLATLASQAAGRSGADWNGSAKVIVELLILMVINFAQGVGFGLLFANTAVAIVSFFALPIVWSLVTAIPALNDAGKWLDLNQAGNVLADGSAAGSDWAKIATSVLLWVVLPLTVGTIRAMRREVK